MSTLFVYPDVPQELLDCLNVIDFTQINETDLTHKLALLRQYGQQYLPSRKDFTRTGLQSSKKIRIGVPQQALDVINEFDFTGVSYMQRVALKPIFMTWIRKNLPTTG